MVNGKARPLIVTAPVPPDTVMLVPGTMDVTPELVRTPDVLVRPVPRRETNDWPPIERLVVDAVTKDA